MMINDKSQRDGIRYPAIDQLDGKTTSKYKLVSGENVEIFEIPWYQGFKQMLMKLFKLISTYRKSCKGCDCYVFRVAQIESFFA